MSLHIVAEGVEGVAVRPPVLRSVAPVMVRVGMAEFTDACKAILPHVAVSEEGSNVVRIQFTDTNAVIFGAGLGSAAAAKVEVRDGDGFTGDPDSDTILIHAAVLKAILALFKPTRREGLADPMQELELDITPDRAAARANSEEYQAAQLEERPIFEEQLKPPAALKVTDVSGLLPGTSMTAPTVAANDPATGIPKTLSTYALADASSPERRSLDPFSMSSTVLLGLTRTAKVYSEEIVAAPRGDGMLLVTIGDAFTALLPARERVEELHRLDALSRQAWADLLQEVAS